MMVNAQLCGIALLLTIIILYFSQRTIMIKTQTSFKDVLFIALFSVVLDACSMILITSAGPQDEFLTKIVCKAYLVSIIFVVYASLMYLLSDLEYLYQGISKFKAAMGYLAIFAGIAAFIVPIHIHRNGSGSYTYGYGVLITYIVAFIFIVSMIRFIVVDGANLDIRRKVTGIVWMSIWLGAALIQFFSPQFKVIGFGSCLGVAVLFLKLENPESYIDKETGLLNQQSLSIYIRERVSQQKNFSSIIIMLDDLHKFLEPYMVEGAQAKIAKFLDSLQDCTAFHNHGMKYTILVDHAEDTGRILADIQQKMNGIWEFRNDTFMVKARCFVVPRFKMDAEQYEAMSSVFVSEKQSHTVGAVCYMDENWIREYERNEEIADIITDAIKNDRVMIYFQPIYDMRKEVFASAEVLVRIKSKTGHVYTPDMFIPVAEDNDSIIELGELIFRKACKYLASVDAERLGIKYLEVNVSAIQSTTDDFAERFIRIMEETGVRPEQINLEITESAALRSKSILLTNMNRLIEYGVSFSLDDFGTGFSNLNYILELPVEIVKLDHQMTHAYFSGDKGKLIMESVIHMIQSVGMKIVAEGVDTAEQVELLAPEHINYIQGFHFTKPLPEEEYEQFLLKNNKGAILENH